MSADGFPERRALFVPSSQCPLIHGHAVLVPRSKLRPLIGPREPFDDPDCGHGTPGAGPAGPTPEVAPEGFPPRPLSKRPWPQWLFRAFGIAGLKGSKCPDGRPRLVQCIPQGETIRTTLPTPWIFPLRSRDRGSPELHSRNHSISSNRMPETGSGGLLWFELHRGCQSVLLSGPFMPVNRRGAPAPISATRAGATRRALKMGTLRNPGRRSRRPSAGCRLRPRACPGSRPCERSDPHGH